MDAWEAKHHRMLVKDNLRMRTQYLTVAHREDSEEHRVQTFHSLVIRGKLQTTVQ